MRKLHVRLLGDFHLAYGDQPVSSIDTPRLQSLFAYLILHRASPQSRQHLAFLFWPDSTEKQARTNLRQLLHHLRGALQDPDRFLHSGPRTIQWRPEAPYKCDVGEFEDALTAAKQSEANDDRTSVRTARERAAALYQGDLLPSCYEEWIAPERERLREEHSKNLERLVLLLEEERDYSAAIRYSGCLLRHDPLSETTYGTLIRLHALNGDRAAAMGVYERCAAVLDRELGVAPGPSIRQMYEGLQKLELSRTPNILAALPRHPAA